MSERVGGEVRLRAKSNPRGLRIVVSVTNTRLRSVPVFLCFRAADIYATGSQYGFNWEFSTPGNGRVVWNGTAFWEGGHLWNLSVSNLTLVQQAQLSITPVGTAAIQASWRTNNSDHVLEYVSSLPAAGWSTVTNAVTTNANRLSDHYRKKSLILARILGRALSLPIQRFNDSTIQRFNDSTFWLRLCRAGSIRGFIYGLANQIGKMSRLPLF